jgi:uncharacterized membrane protein YdbT with pleckstrin-like domain
MDQYPSQNNVNNPLNVMSPGEQVVCSIKRHPIGLFGIYSTVGFLLIVLFAGVGLLPHFVTSLTTQDKLYIFVAAIAFALIVLLFLYVAVVVYHGNRWIVTSDSITQVTQTGLFQKHTSQLSLGNLEDVTFEQDGLIPTMFGFGTLKVETAGERSKFQFPYCPKPKDCAIEIIQAHERYLLANPDGTTHDNQGLTQNPGSFNPTDGVNTNTQS